MKKLFSLSLAIVMLVLCITPAFAFSQSMEISTSTDTPEYELSFPADIEIPWQSNETVIGQIKAEKMIIEPDKKVAVTVSSQNDFNLVNVKDNAKAIQYTLVYDDISFFPGDYGESFTLTAEIEDKEWLYASSGRHSDILTFTAEYTDAV